MDECCAVCAEPLEWTGYGPCGHLQTCSKCVARLRFVLKDKRCTICQQETDIVFFTKFMGNFTKKLTTEQFHALQGGREYKYLSIINGYFDDVSQFNSINALCSYTHPEVGNEKFQNLRALKMHMKENLRKQFCEICLRGRKVFVCEQLLYTQKEIRRHMTQGDLYGPLAEGGFKGHPKCEFCKTRFFSETELFKHNSERHETCFICRRDQPQIYRYYRDYTDLEEHFKNAHHPCVHPQCLEARFIVFRTEEDLKMHFRDVHERREGGRAQRREATVIETNFHFSHQAARNGRSRFHPGARQEYAPSSRVDDMVPVHDPNGFSEQRLELTDEDFPSFIDAPVPVQTGWPVKGSRNQLQMREDQFPSLPGQAASAKSTVSRGEGTMAARLASSKSPVLTRPAAQQLPNPNLMPMRGIASAPQLTQGVQPDRQSPPPSWPHRRQKPEKLENEPSAWVTLSKKNERTAEDFPALVKGGAVPNAPPSWGRQQEKPKPEPPPKAKMPSVSDVDHFPSLTGSHPHQPGSLGSARGGVSSKVSEGLKSANKVLIKKLKDQMDATTFQEFHGEADVFLKDGLSAVIFHMRLVNHGLAHYVAEIANLCPSPTKRSELLTVHENFIQQCKQNPSNAPVFVPLSVLEQSYQRAMEQPPWICARCSTLNLSDADFCESCDASRSEKAMRPERIPPVPSVYRKSSSHPRTLFNVDSPKHGTRSNAWRR